MHPPARYSADFAEQRRIDGLGFGFVRLAIEALLGQDQLRAAGNDSIQPLLTGWDARFVMAWRRLLERSRAGSLTRHLDQNVRRPRAGQRISRGIVRVCQDVVVHDGLALVAPRAYSSPHGSVTMRNIPHHL